MESHAALSLSSHTVSLFLSAFPPNGVAQKSFVSKVKSCNSLERVDFANVDAE